MTPGRSATAPSRAGLATLFVLGLALLVTHSARGVSADAPPAPVARYGDARLYLSWREPYGMPRATDRWSPACDDTNEVDTLFVSFDVSKPNPGLESLGVVVYFHPQSDTLGSFWHFKRGWENEMNLLVDFDANAGIVGEPAWLVPGNGTVSYDHRSGRGRLDLGFKVPRVGARPLVAGQVYTAARIRIRHRRTDLAGCRQPVCVEASELDLRFTTRRRIASPQAGQRFVGWNAPNGGDCRPSASSAIKPWRPK